MYSNSRSIESDLLVAESWLAVGEQEFIGTYVSMLAFSRGNALSRINGESHFKSNWQVPREREKFRLSKHVHSHGKYGQEDVAASRAHGCCIYGAVRSFGPEFFLWSFLPYCWILS
uniref:Uncharacterized protein n=1 Tax=Arundo donax TaxID=35708 RepID=A0A0A9D0I0_ARUDO